MEAYHHAAMLSACYTCVNMTWFFALTTVGAECIPNGQAFSGVLQDHAELKQECKSLRFKLVPVPNITKEEMEEWLGVTITTPMPSTTTTTQLPLTEKEKCYKCVQRGRHYIRIISGFSFCVLSRSDFEDNIVLEEASNPRKCRRIDWANLDLQTTEPPASQDPPMLASQVSYVGAICGVVSAVIIGTVFITGATLYIYSRKCRVVPEDQQSFGMREEPPPSWVFNYHRGEGVDETDGAVEMNAV